MILRPLLWLTAAALLYATLSAAQTPLALPDGATETHRSTESPGTFALPTGRFTAQTQPTQRLEGRILLRAWHLPDRGGAPLEVIRRLRPQLEQAGFDILFECNTTTCGGFDFRINTRVLPPPAMRFDLTDFQVLTAQRSGTAPSHITLLASASALQAIEVTPLAIANLPLSVPAARTAPAAQSALRTAADLETALATQARAVLTGISFASGAQSLGEAQQDALAPLAEMLTNSPDLSIVIVGHTDNAGSLAANIALSRARARAVRQTLIDRYDIAPRRVEADGVGYLLPLAPNTSPENRALNRRVEVVLR